VTWRREPINDDQVLDALKGVCDPELGISFVDQAGRLEDDILARIELV
jgi:metal-sulfur cluster biosynthetic enzyme